MSCENKLAIFTESKTARRVIPSDISLTQLCDDIKMLKDKLGISAVLHHITELGSDLILSAGQVKEIKGALKFNNHKVKFNGGKIKFV